MEAHENNRNHVTLIKKNNSNKEGKKFFLIYVIYSFGKHSKIFLIVY